MATARIAVFGSSEPVPGEPLYEQAREVGDRLARAGFAVVTGGYGGVMEATSRGAHEAGGHTIGVACRIFADRSPNGYLGEVTLTPDLFERTRSLIAPVDGFVVLSGKAGTLAELSMLWALQRAGCLDGRPVVLLGRVFQALLAHLSEIRMLEAAQMEATCVVRTPEAAVAALSAIRPVIEED